MDKLTPEELHDVIRFFFNLDDDEIEKILRSGAINLDNNLASTKYQHPLHSACEKGTYEMVELLINSGIDVNGYDSLSYTPLYHAVVGKHVRIVKFLLEKGANFGKNLSGDAVLYRFESDFDSETLDIIKLLVDCNIIRSLEPLLVNAVIREDVLLLKFVIDMGVDVDTVIKKGKTALCVACEEGNYEIAEVLINSGADVNTCDSCHQRPLYYAVIGKHASIVDLLLENDATFDDDADLTDSEISEYFGGNFNNETLDIVQLLLDYGILSPELLLAYSVNKEIMPLLQFLIEGGVDINSIVYFDYYGDTDDKIMVTLLGASCYRENIEMVEILLKNGADPNMEDQDGEFPLMMANDVLILETLLKYGADVNRRNAQGNTALHLCCAEETMIFLISRGINTESRNNVNETALESLTRKSVVLFNYERLIEVYKKCMIEISKMKKLILNNYGLSLHEILTMNRHELSRYMNNINLKTIFKGKKFFANFPIFGKKLKEKFGQGEKRKELMNNAAQSLENLSGVKIPELVLPMLFKYFTDRQIESTFLAK